MKKMTQYLVKNAWLRQVLPPLSGFLAYGGWAFFCNYSHGVTQGLRAMLVQGSYSFVITLLLTAMMEMVFVRVQRMWPVWVLTMSILICLSYSLNWFAGTPNIVLTIFPGLVFSGIFCMTYLRGLIRLQPR